MSAAYIKICFRFLIDTESRTLVEALNTVYIEKQQYVNVNNMPSLLTSTVSSLILLSRSSTALKVDFTSPQSIKSAAKTIAADIVSIYDGENSSGIPGLFPQTYYWWESGLAWDCKRPIVNTTEFRLMLITRDTFSSDQLLVIDRR